ncbi:MAG TPA: glycosyltransferase family 2 protein [Xanthomonadaceae bacterium]|nr:glycosyltransferase family 2 protein [Xanthomonadaceae bacterium]
MPASTPEPVQPGPLISVALCTYNGALYLREQLDSVLAQSEVTIEIVVVDDGSSDGTAAILDEYAARDARIRWQGNERNLGPTANFERAMSLCGGKFIAPCDQDDLWHPEKLARLLAAIGDHDLAYCDSDYVDAHGTPMQRRLSDDTTMFEGTSALTFLFVNSVPGHGSLLRRSLFERARPFPVGAYHDWWLALCAAGRNGVRYLDRPLVRFRRHEQAFCPVGKSSDGVSRDASLSLAWLEQRHALMQAYAGTSLRDAGVAQDFAQAMRQSIDHGSSGELMRMLWRHRRALPRWKGLPIIDALEMQIRVSKKLRRIRHLPPRDDIKRG